MQTKIFTGVTQTKNGTKTRNVKWSPAAGAYLGQVWDETAARPDKWTSCVWSSTGKNRIRPEFNL